MSSKSEKTGSPMHSIFHIPTHNIYISKTV